MQFNTCKTLAIASVLILGTAGELALNIAPASANSPQQVAQNQSVLASGQFVTVQQNKNTEGTVRILRENGKRYLEFDSAFSTAQGPDVNVILHRNNTVAANLDNDADYFTLASIQGFNGAQRYELPEYIELDNYNSVAIWCRKFNVTFGYAPL